MAMRLPKLTSTLRSILPSTRSSLLVSKTILASTSSTSTRSFLTSTKKSYAKEPAFVGGSSTATKTDMMTGEIIGSSDIDVSQNNKNRNVGKKNV